MKRLMILLALGIAVSCLGQQADVASEPKPIPGGPIRAFCIDFNWGEGGPNGFAKPGLWADADPKEHIAWYAGLGCTVIQTFAVSCNGYAWYKGGIVPEQPGLKTDFLPQMVRLGHEKGMKVMGYFCVGANTRWGLEHPDLSYEAPSWPHIPFTTEYLDFLCASIVDALNKTSMDGFMVDWVWNPGDIDNPVKPLRWMDCEKTMYHELLGEPFPGTDQVTPETEIEFRRRAIARCWERIHAAAKEAKPDSIIWLSCCNVNSPSVADSVLFRQVDWLMNEATNGADLFRIQHEKISQARLIQCVVGWGDQHDARTLVSHVGAGYGLYGFAKPGPSSLPLLISEYTSRPIASFQGNDRNIAVLTRFYNQAPMDTVTNQEEDGSIVLTPETVNALGNSPVVMEGQIGHWGNEMDSVFWMVSVKRPARFRAEAEVAVEKGAGGSTLIFQVQDAPLVEWVTQETGSWRTYETVSLGEAEIPQQGTLRISLLNSRKTPWRSVSLKVIRLTPIKDEGKTGAPDHGKAMIRLIER